MLRFKLYQDSEPFTAWTSRREFSSEPNDYPVHIAKLIESISDAFAQALFAHNQRSILKSVLCWPLCMLIVR